MTSSLNVLFIDNFDSFSFNLVDDFRKLGCRVEVYRNDLTAPEAMGLALALAPPAMIVLSPGPGAPEQAGCCVDLVRLAEGRIPLFGVCLGHQAIIAALGGEVGYAGEVVHGKARPVTHDGQGIFAGLPQPLWAARYHSLAGVAIPGELCVTARCGDVVMAVAHRHQPLVGVQFHPESILTTRGGRLIERVIMWGKSRTGGG